MKHIKFFMDYLTEQFQQEIGVGVPNNPMSVGNVNNLKDLEKKLKDYNSQKNKIRNIFLNDKLSDDQVSQQLRDFLKNKDVNKFVFENDFSQLEADVCNMARQIRKKEDRIKKLEDDLKSKNKTPSPLEISSRTFREDMADNSEKEKTLLNKELRELQLSIDRKEKLKNKTLAEFNKKIQNMKKELLTSNT